MTIALVAGTAETQILESTFGDNPENLTYDSGVAGTNRLLIAFVSWERGASPITAVTCSYGGDSCAQVAQIDGPTGGTYLERMAAFVLVDPATGSNTFAITPDAGPDNYDLCVTFAIYEGVDQTTPTGATATQSYATGTVATVDITTTTESALISAGICKNRSDVGPFTAATDNTIVTQDESTEGANLGQAVAMLEMEAPTAGTYTAGGNATSTTATSPIISIAVEILPNVATPESLNPAVYHYIQSMMGE